MPDPAEHLRRYADDITRSVSPARSRVAAMEAIGKVPDTARAPRRHSTAWRVQVAGAALAGLFVLNFAAAAAADSSVPGDTFYFLDRAYEQVAGFFGEPDHGAERAAEAQVLVERGEAVVALQLLAETSQVTEVRETAEMLLVAELDGQVLLTHARSLVNGFDILASNDDQRSREEALAAVRLLAAQVEESLPETPGESNRPETSDDTQPPDRAGGPAVTPASAGTTPSQAGSASPPGHAGETGPPDHAGETGPPDHAADPSEGSASSDPGKSSADPPADVGGSEPPDHAGETGPPDHAGQPGPPAQGGSSGGGGDSTPPGQDGSNPGQGNDSPPGRGGSNPGQGNSAPPGQGGSNPGQGNSTSPGKGNPQP